MTKRIGARRTITAAVSAMALAAPVHQAHAGNEGAAAAAGFLGGMLLNQAIQNQRQRQSGARSSSRRGGGGGGGSAAWSAERQQTAQVQKALNDFDFPVGTADGITGHNTRTGISNYQAYMGWPATGQLAPHERDVLMRSHGTYNAGTADSAWPGLVDREGVRGILKASRDPNYYASNYGGGLAGGGTTYASEGGTLQGGNANPGQQAAAAPVTPLDSNTTTQVVTPVTAPPAPLAAVGDQGGQKLPDLTEILGEAPVSMQGRCDFVKLTTQTNQGQIMANNMADPDQALSEQFCDARTYMVNRAQSMLAMARTTEDAVLQSCGQIAAAMTPVAGSLTTKGPDIVRSDIAGVSSSLGLADAANAATYGEICLGLGYRTDDAEMALAGALVLIGAGRAPFAEMVGHHVREGFGTAKNAEAATVWYEAGLNALAGNEAPAVLPSQSIQRTAIIRSAIDVGAQRASAEPTSAVVPVSNMLTPLNLGQN